MVVQYVSNTLKTSSKVYYSTNSNADFSKESNEVKVISGTSRSYTGQYYIIRNLLNPSMGEPLATEAEILSKEDTKGWAYDHATGEHYANWYNVTTVQYGFGQYNNPYMYYTSPLLHTVQLTNLKSDTTYYYRVSGSCEIYSFTTPVFYYSDDTTSTEQQVESLYPFVVGLTGDIGQTDISLKSMAALAALESDVVLLVGDLSYADGYGDSWDTFGRAFETLASHVPVLTTGGNHEVQSGECFYPYSLRYFTPYYGSDSPDPVFWGREVGPTHIIALNSYSAWKNTSIQYEWLESYMSKINRARTPWVIVMMHTAWYCSNQIHWMEGELSRQSMEHLLYHMGVDIVLSGHVHAYERTFNVYNNELNPCGFPVLVLGDGGNYEGPATPWRIDPKTATGAPIWSAFRESSFGIGELVIHNDTHAYYSWHRVACGSSSQADYHMDFSSICVTPNDNSAEPMETSDTTWFIRPSIDECPNRHFGSDYEPVNPYSYDDNKDNNDSNYAYSITVIALICGCTLLGITSIILLVVVIFLQRKLDDKISGYGGGDDYMKLQSA
jgi:hypothetical protein